MCECRVVRWIIDGNNVMGSGADGWWNDPPKAAARLTQVIAQWCRANEADQVLLVFDGKPVGEVEVLAGGNLAVAFAPAAKRDAADDLIVERVSELFVEPDLTVVTSDKGLVARLPPGVEVRRSGSFRREQLGLAR